MKAFIRAIEEIKPIEGRDKIHQALVQGCWIITSKEKNIGDVGIFFEVDGVINDEYLFHNSLYASKEKNKDSSLKGYFPNNGRIRALKFSFGISNGLFMPLSSLEFLGVDVSALKIGQDVSNLKDKEGKNFDLVVKYEPPEEILNETQSKTAEKGSALFPQHVDTKHWFREQPKIGMYDLVYITNKMHGTSARYGYLPRWKVGGLLGKILRMFPFGWKHYIGSRRVQLKNNSEGYHGSNNFRFQVLEEIDIPKGYAIYGEIVGYANGNPIMHVHDGSQMGEDFVKKFGKDIVYNYGNEKGKFNFWVYRVTKLDENDKPVDLSYLEIEDFCKKHNLLMPKLLEEFFDYVDTRDINDFVSKEIEKYEDPQFPEIPREGVIIRIERENGGVEFYKQKTFAFRVLEGHETLEGKNE